MKKRLIAILQLVLGVELIGVILCELYAKGHLGRVADAFRMSARNWPLVAAGAGLFLVCMVLCAARWRILLRTQGVNLSLARSLELYFVGHFFNAFMLGSTGGDLAKAYYAAKVTSHRKTEVISTIFIDRIIGLMCLVGTMVLVMLCRLGFFLDNPKMRWVMLFDSLLFLGVVAGLIVVFRRNLFESWGVFRALEEKTALGKILARAYDAFRACLVSPRVWAQTVLLTVLNILSYIVMAWLLGRAIGVRLPFLDFLTAIPIVSAISSIPVTPSGLGTRDAAMVYMFGIFGVSNALALSLSFLFFLGVITGWSLVGGIVYMFYAIRVGRVNDEELTVDANHDS